MSFGPDETGTAIARPDLHLGEGISSNCCDNLSAGSQA